MKFSLRRWTEGDIESLVNHADNRNIADFLADDFPSPYTYDDGREFLATIRNDDPLQIFAIDVDGEAVGSIGIFPQSGIHRKNAEIGYWLSEEYWGEGIMTEAIKRITLYGFGTFDIVRIFARPFSTNRGSQRVLQKAGFTFEARFSKVLFKNNEFLDEMYYAIRRDDIKSNEMIKGDL